ncbi:MAG TPA: hypothetical protein VMI73_08820 [Trebonia sp.]|nr:hypothetical protein [Trebonia sp.]
MAVLVDPPQRDGAEERPSDETPAPAVTTTTAAPVTVPDSDADADADAGEPKLAEPPITGGRVEEFMGRIIRVLSHSPLARPLPAVILSALGLCGVAFVGLCATAYRPSVATPPVLLPLTTVARNHGAPHLPDLVANFIMYISVSLCCLGLAMMLWANSRGWSPNPRKVFWTAAAAIAVLVNITPVGSSDVASYAAYGRIAALGYNPYTFTPAMLPGGKDNVYTELVSRQWQGTASVYGPLATWTHLLAAWIGGDRPWLTIWVLMIMIGAAFLATGYVLLRTAENPVRAVLLWAANPLLIVELVMGGHLDSFLALFAVAAVVVCRSGARNRLAQDFIVGLCVGLALGIKVNAAFVALAVAIPFMHDRAWARLARTGLVAAATTFSLYFFSYGLAALEPLRKASTMVISPTLWRLVQVTAEHFYGKGAEATVTSAFGIIWPPLMLLLAWYLYNRLSPDVPTVVAATCALTFAWIVVAPWSLPWYSAVAWVALALLPRNSLTRWLTIATAALGLLHFNGGHLTNERIGPTP